MARFSKVLINDQRTVDYVAQKTNHHTWDQQVSIGLEQDGKIVAGFLYDNYNGALCAMHVAADRFDREFLRIAFDYPFRQLDLKSVYGPVASTNTAACNLAIRLGGKLHTVIPDGHPDGDLCIFLMRRDECRYWRQK